MLEKRRFLNKKQKVFCLIDCEGWTDLTVGCPALVTHVALLGVLHLGLDRLLLVRLDVSLIVILAGEISGAQSTFLGIFSLPHLLGFVSTSVKLLPAVLVG